MLYPAFIEYDSDGSASGWFPDVPGCYFAGDTLEEAHDDAKSAINAHFELLSEKGQELPLARSQHDHIATSTINYSHGVWLLIDVNMEKYDGKTERINITLPHRLLNRIDNLVKTHPEYGSRSAFIATAARKELQKNIS